jgi:hypothetical protein
MERRGRIILISLFILTIFFTGCKKDEFFETKKDSKNKEHYDNFNKAKKEKEKEKEKYIIMMTTAVVKPMKTKVIQDMVEKLPFAIMAI